MARTLTSQQIKSIQQAIATRTGQFDFDVTMEDVWAEVERVMWDEREEVGIRKGKKWIGWQTAAENAEDQWGVYYALFDRNGSFKGNSHLTF